MLQRVNISVGCLMVIAGAQAHADTVKCKAPGDISAAIAKLKPATNYVTVNVSGTCTDNLYIPPGLSVNLIGAKNTSLAPTNPSDATVDVEGRLVVASMAITTGNFAAIFANRGGYATVQADTITGPGTGLQVSDNSGALVQNSSLAVTGFSAINTYAGSNVEIDSIAPLYGATATSVTGGSDGVYCGSGSITLYANSGSISISNSGRYGIEAYGCSVKAFSPNGTAMSINANGVGQQYGMGLQTGSASSVELDGVAINNNGGYGVNVYENSTLELSGSTVTGNGTIAAQASQNGVVHFKPYNGVNTVTEPQSDTDVLFGCYQGGKIYVDQIAGTITPAPTQAQLGCLTVGGP